MWLVARREILERGRSRGFIFSIAFTTLIIIGSFVIPMLLFSDDETTKVGVLAPAPAGLAATLERQSSALGRSIEVVDLADSSAAVTALESGEVDAVAEAPGDLSGPGSVRFWESADPLLSQVVLASVIELRSAAVVTASDVDAVALAAAQEPPQVTLAGPAAIPRDTLAAAGV
jgi:ABC-2 type transport system permease protein